MSTVLITQPSTTIVISTVESASTSIIDGGDSLSDIDGGFANTTYGTEQIIDGGDANG